MIGLRTTGSRSISFPQKKEKKKKLIKKLIIKKIHVSAQATLWPRKNSISPTPPPSGSAMVPKFAQLVSHCLVTPSSQEKIGKGLKKKKS